MTKIIGKYHFFYKARSPLTNWWKEDYTVTKEAVVGAVGSYKLTFNCSEQAMMFTKAMYFGDTVTAQRIMLEKHPSKQKEWGRKVRGFVEEKWVAVREELIYEVLKDKFLNSSQETKDYLKNTAPLILVEASPIDPIWGICMSEEEPGIEDESNWKGLNLLGKLLTKVRIDIYGE